MSISRSARNAIVFTVVISATISMPFVLYKRVNALGRLVATPEAIEVRVVSSDASKSDQTVRIKNSGQSAIQIIAVEASCSCTIIREGIPAELGAGSGFDLHVKATPPEYGEQSSLITIRNSSSVAPTLRIPVRMFGRVRPVPFVVHHPKDIQVTVSKETKRGSVRFQLVTNETATAASWISGFTSDDDRCSARLMEPISSPIDDVLSQRTYTVIVDADTRDSLPSDKFRATLTPTQRTPAVIEPPKIRLIGVVTSAISVVPPQAVVTDTDLNGETAVCRRITLIGAGDREWQVTDLQCDATCIDVSHEGVGNTVAVLKLEINPSTLRAQRNSIGEFATVTVSTSHPDSPSLEVKILLPSEIDKCK